MRVIERLVSKAECARAFYLPLEAAINQDGGVENDVLLIDGTAPVLGRRGGRFRTRRNR